MGTLVREFFEETHVPILYINMDTYLPRLNLAADARAKTMYGAHAMTGRLEDLALAGEYGEKESHAAGPVSANEGLATLGKLGFSGSLSLGSWVPDVMAHGGGEALPKTAAERAAWGKEGEEQVRAIVKKMKLPEAMRALQQHDRYTRDVVVPKFRDRLPKAP